MSDRALVTLTRQEVATRPTAARRPRYQLTKRVLDLTFSAAVLLVCLPLLLLIGAAIRLESAGPVFFRQLRTGRYGVPFPMLKFRSMYYNAEQARAGLAQGRQHGPVFKLRNDPRVTRVGRFLRRTSLDELPQFLNVLLGQMSLVGPRPLPIRDIERWHASTKGERWDEVVAWLAVRQTVRPGISGLWQVRGRSLLPFEDWIRYDVQYVNEQGWRLDLEILARTPFVTLTGLGAV